MDDDFDGFVEKVLVNLPGYASRMYERFVGPPDAEIDFIGRQERLVDDLRTALQQAGVYSDAVNLEFDRVNAGRDNTAHVRFTPTQYDALAAAERRGMDRFGYQ